MQGGAVRFRQVESLLRLQVTTGTGRLRGAALRLSACRETQSDSQGENISEETHRRMRRFIAALWFSWRADSDE